MAAAAALLSLIALPGAASAAWQLQDVAPTGQPAIDWYAPGWYSSVVVDSAGVPHVAYRGVQALDSKNEVQQVTVDATAGAFTLTYSGQQTGPLAYDITAAGLQSALTGLSSIGAGNVAVTGGPGGPGGLTPYVVTFQNYMGLTNVSQMTVNPSLLTGTAAVTTTVSGPSSNANPIRYAYWDGSTWRGEASATPENVSAAVSLPSTTTGYGLSLALDSHGYPHIAFATSPATTSDSYRLRYASWTGSAWMVETVEQGPTYQAAPGAWTGIFPSLAIDSADTPHISYIDCQKATDARTCPESYTNSSGVSVTGNGTLMYATKAGGWTSTQLDIAGADVSVDGKTSLALDGADHPRVAYYDRLGSQLKYTHLVTSGLGTSWTTPEVVAAPAAIGLSMALHDGMPRIAYIANGALKYASWNGLSWAFSTLVTSGLSTGVTGAMPVLGVDGSDVAHIADIQGGKVWYGSGSFTGSGASQQVSEASLADYYPSLSVNATGHTGVTYFKRVAGTTGPLVYADLKAAQSIAFAPPADRSYGAEDFDPGASASSSLAVSYQSQTPSVCTIASGKVHIVGPGQCAITASQPGDANYEPAADVTHGFQVAPATLTIIGAVAHDKTYDGTIKATVDFSGAFPMGVVGNDVVMIDSSNYWATFQDKSIGEGKPVNVTDVALTGDSAWKYTVVQPNELTASISAAGVTVSGITAKDKVYDGTRTATLDTGGATAPGLMPDDLVALDTSSASGQFADKNVGQGKPVDISGVALVGPDASNYTLTVPAGVTASIIPAEVTVSGIAAKDKVYDGTREATLDTGGATAAGLFGDDQVALDTSGASGQFIDENVGQNKPVDINGLALAGADAPNYTLLMPVTATASITAAEVTVSGITAKDKVYDGTKTATLDMSNATVTGMVDGDQVAPDMSGASGMFADKNVGKDKPVDIGGVTLTGPDASNYTLTQPAGVTASITAAEVTVSGITAKDKVYDGTKTATLDTTGAKPDGLIAGDVVSLDTSGASGQFADKDVGKDKPVDISGLVLTGADASNYTLTQPVGVTASITAAEVTVSGITAKDRVYDGTKTATLDTSGAQPHGLVAGDVVSLDASGASGQFTDKNVGQNKTVNISGVTLTGADTDNYTVKQPTATASISVRALTVSATGVNKTYDTSTDATVTLSTDKVAGDDVTVGYTSAAFENATVGQDKAVNVSGISITGGADKDNYELANKTATTTADITPAKTTTTVTVDPTTQQYSETVKLDATVAGPGTPTGSIQFKVDGVNVGDPQTLAGGKASLTYKVTQAPGPHTVSAVYTADANWSDSTGTAGLTVTKESASAEYGGFTFFWGTSASASSASVTLAATITDDADGSRGDIRNATVSFVNRDTGDVLCSNLPVGLVSASDTTVGTATCTITLPIDTNLGASSYTIGIVVSGSYARDDSNDDTLITVAQPITSTFITGGGYLINRYSSGLYPGETGKKTNFGFSVKYSKTGKNLQGRINVIVRNGGHVYQIKGNAMTSLVTQTLKSPWTATFNGKASIQDITHPLAPISIDGNATLQVSMTDKGEPGSADTIGITVWNKNGGVWFSSNWSATKTIEQLVAGGNLAVH